MTVRQPSASVAWSDLGIPRSDMWPPLEITHWFRGWHKDDYLQLGVAVGTLGLAVSTVRLGRATNRASEAEQKRFQQSLTRQEAEIVRQGELRRSERSWSAATRLLEALNESGIDAQMSAPVMGRSPFYGVGALLDSEAATWAERIRNTGQLILDELVWERVLVTSELLRISSLSGQDMAERQVGDKGAVWVHARFAVEMLRGTLVAFLAERPVIETPWQDLPPDHGAVVPWLQAKAASQELGWDGPKRAIQGTASTSHVASEDRAPAVEPAAGQPRRRRFSRRNPSPWHSN